MVGKQFLEAYGAKLFSRRIVAAWLIATASLTMTGPFGTFEGFPVVPRCLYWLVVVAASFVIGLGVETAVRMTFPELAAWPETLLTGSLLTVLYTPFLYVFTVWMGSGDDLTMSPILMAAVVFAVPVVFRATVNLIFPAQAETSDARPGEAIRPKLLRRIGEEDVTEVTYLSMRDHYVDVFTNAGKRSLLMRFSDAIDELDDVAGLRVHRSHWVAIDAVERLERDGGRTYLHLRCGHKLPVSRAYRDVVEQAVPA